MAFAAGGAATVRARFEEALRGRPTNKALWGRFYLAVEDGDGARARALEPALAARGSDGRSAGIYLSARGVLALAEGDPARAGAFSAERPASSRARGDDAAGEHRGRGSRPSSGADGRWAVADWQAGTAPVGGRVLPLRPLRRPAARYPEATGSLGRSSVMPSGSFAGSI